MDVLFYLKDTGYQTPDLSGTRDEWLVNQGEPIRIHVTSFNINSQANAVITSQIDDTYYLPTIISRELTKLSIQFYVISDFVASDTIYIYDKTNAIYEPINNPPVSAIVALLEQMIGKQSHFDLYMSDGSGITPTYFKKLPLYWLSKVKTYNSDTYTAETHLNVKILSYVITKADEKRFNITLSTVVLL